MVRAGVLRGVGATLAGWHRRMARLKQACSHDTLLGWLRDGRRCDPAHSVALKMMQMQLPRTLPRRHMALCQTKPRKADSVAETEGPYVGRGAVRCGERY